MKALIDWLKPYISIGYTAQEFHRDRHVAWVVIITYLIARLPEIKSYSSGDFKQDAWTVGVMVIVTLGKSYLGRTNPPLST